MSGKENYEQALIKCLSIDLPKKSRKNRNKSSKTNDHIDYTCCTKENLVQPIKTNPQYFGFYKRHCEINQSLTSCKEINPLCFDKELDNVGNILTYNKNHTWSFNLPGIYTITIKLAFDIGGSSSGVIYACLLRGNGQNEKENKQYFNTYVTDWTSELRTTIYVTNINESFNIKTYQMSENDTNIILIGDYATYFSVAKIA